jgi:hypothetical protein
VRYRYEAKDGELHIDDRPDPGTASVVAGIEGDADAWVAALGPLGDHSRLQLTGYEQLAKGVLASLPGPVEQGLPQ